MRAPRLLLLIIVLLAVGCGQPSTARLLDNLKSADAPTRINAARTLPERKADAAQVIPALTDALKDDHTDVRRCAAHGLGTFAGDAKSAIPALQVALNDREPSVRKAAGAALHQIDPTRFADPTKIKR